MDKRLELHNLLVSILKTNNAYYQSPENIKMVYPCIRYKRYDIEHDKANNKNYRTKTKYQLIYISKQPDDDTVYKLLDTIPYSVYDRSYTSDNLYHDVITLFY